MANALNNNLTTATPNSVGITIKVLQTINNNGLQNNLNEATENTVLKQKSRGPCSRERIKKSLL